MRIETRYVLDSDSVLPQCIQTVLENDACMPDKSAPKRNGATSSASRTISLVQIETFLAIVDEGGLKRAAHKLEADESSLRERISNLEKWTGRTLFTKRPSFKITPDGNEFLDLARAIKMALCAYRDSIGFEHLLDIKGQSYGDIILNAVSNKVTGRTIYEID